MKKFTYFLVVLSLLMGVSHTMMAQQGERPNRGNREGGQGDRQGRQQMSFSERQERALKVLTDSLSLSDVQVTGIKKINKSYDQKFEDMRSSAMESGDRSAMRDKMKGLMDNYNTEVKALLNDKQKVKFDKLQEDRRNQRSRNNGRNSEGNSDSRRSRGTRN